MKLGVYMTFYEWLDYIKNNDVSIFNIVNMVFDENLTLSEVEKLVNELRVKYFWDEKNIC